jgi:hypothetical protein
MGAVTAARRVAALETAAMRLLPQREPELSSPAWVCRWLSVNELDRLAHRVERAEAGEAVEASGTDLWADFHQRAVARALLGVDMAELDRREQANRLLLTFDHPDRPGDPMSKLYITVTEDLVERGRWYLDDWYVRRWPSLPAELTTAELQLHAPRPWPPRVAAGEVPP